MKYQLVRVKDENKTILTTGSSDYCQGYRAALELVETWRNLFIETVGKDDRPDRDESHDPGCAMHTISSAECTCGKADRESEEDDHSKEWRNEEGNP